MRIRNTGNQDIFVCTWALFLPFSSSWLSWQHWQLTVWSCHPLQRLLPPHHQAHLAPTQNKASSVQSMHYKQFNNILTETLDQSYKKNHEENVLN
jgi:hypothetical protein